MDKGSTEIEPDEHAESQRASGFFMSWRQLPRVGAFLGALFAAGGAGGFVGSSLQDDVAENSEAIERLDLQSRTLEIRVERSDINLQHLASTLNELKEELRLLRVRLERIGAIPPQALGAAMDDAQEGPTR